jgi:hypothetical protein
VTRKVLRVNLYDLVAKGTALLGFLLSIGPPSSLPAGSGFYRRSR